jgi:hypothetical protein
MPVLIVASETVRNPAILEVRQLPRRFVERVTVLPRDGARPGLWLRTMAEWQLLRYAFQLAPIVAIALIWRDTALPLSQAPVLMVFLIAWIEMRVLRPSPARRRRMADGDEVARTLDLLGVRGRAALARIAAGRGLRQGTLRLVVEQSELSLLPPLTYVTVQSEEGPRVLDLTAEEREIVTDGLFGPSLTEERLHRANSVEATFLREVTLDARGVSAHARLDAALAVPAGE